MNFNRLWFYVHTYVKCQNIVHFWIWFMLRYIPFCNSYHTRCFLFQLHILIKRGVRYHIGRCALKISLGTFKASKLESCGFYNIGVLTFDRFLTQFVSWNSLQKTNNVLKSPCVLSEKNSINLTLSPLAILAFWPDIRDWFWSPSLLWVWLQSFAHWLYTTSRTSRILKRYENKCIHFKVSLLGIDSLWGKCTFIPADLGS